MDQLDHQAIDARSPRPTKEFVRELRSCVKSEYKKLLDFVYTAEFQGLLKEMYDLAEDKRPDFVNQIVLNQDELAKRGIEPPEDFIIARSSFGDRRPTLFSVRVLLPKKFREHWKNVNITFDNQNDWRDFPADRSAWRRPLDYDSLFDFIKTGEEPVDNGVWE